MLSQGTLSRIKDILIVATNNRALVQASFQPPAKFVLSGWAADAPGAAVGILGGCNDVAFSGGKHLLWLSYGFPPEPYSAC